MAGVIAGRLAVQVNLAAVRLTLWLLAAIACAGQPSVVLAEPISAWDLMPPPSLFPAGYTLDESQTQSHGDAFVKQVYVGPGDTSWTVSATVLPSSDAAWTSYWDRQRALAQQDITVQWIASYGEEAVSIADRADAPLTAVRTYVKIGRVVLSVVESARWGDENVGARTTLVQWMERRARELGA